ncbi:MAG: hypothetical protein ACXWUG_13375 [Polyangiales bacterium]
MDPAMQPINGISLERYAELGALISDFMNDQQRVAQTIQGAGVNLADWEAAKTGWTARMQDMNLMGRVAMAYMPLYQAALAKSKGGQAMASYEDFVAGQAAMKVYGPEVGLKACGVSMSDWTEVSGHWQGNMAREMGRYAGHFNLVTQEEQRLRAGGQPKQIQVQRVAGQVPATPQAGANPYAAAMGADPSQVPANASPVQAAMMNPAYQASMANAAQINQNPMGFGLGQAMNYMTGGIVPGSNVLVTWSNGQSYPGRVMQTGPQQMQIEFQGGRQEWVPVNAVRKA